MNFIDLSSRRKPLRPSRRPPAIEPPSAICIPPRPFHFSPDWASSALYYDASGRPKRYAPSRRLPNGEWAYALSPFRDAPPLSGLRLEAHLAEIRQRPRSL